MVRVLLIAFETSDCRSKAIARRLGVSPRTVDQYFSVAMHALGVDSRHGAVIQALREGMLGTYRLIQTKGSADPARRRKNVGQPSKPDTEGLQY
jgi:DNA-binding CsgD family transcriptional regulator